MTSSKDTGVRALLGLVQALLDHIWALDYSDCEDKKISPAMFPVGMASSV